MRSNIRALLAALTLSAALPALAQGPPAQTGPGNSSLMGIVSTDGAPGSCPYCDLRNLDLSGRDFTNANLLGANLSGANLSNAILDGVMLSGANLSNATLDNARLDATPEGDADLSRANLTNASLQGARMNGTDLQYAELAGTDLTNADLTAARLGPRPRFGTSGSRATIFSKTRISGGVDFGGPTPPGVIIVAEERTAGAAAGPAQWTCGLADLSGLQTLVYVATTGADSATCGGSPAAACKTIQQGITNCTGPACGVLVAWGEYPVTAALALATGINVYGGCLPPEQASPAYFSVILAPPGGQPAVAAYNLSSTSTVLQNFQIGGSAAGGNGQASIAMTVAFSNGLSMLDLEVLANAGSPGTAGSSGSRGKAGGDGDGASAGKNGNCDDTSGGEGAVKMEVSVDGTLSFTCRASCSERNCYGYPGSPASTNIGASGGQPGDGNCANCPDKPGTAGTHGDDGRDGRCGSPGKRSANVIGTFTGLSWSPSNGNDGGSGGAGGGGGGGGAGGYKAGVCFTDKSEKPGNRGGGGGAGGCGAGLGRGGQQGGGSFAILAQGTSLHFTRSRLVGGRGADGGAGGPGGTGGAGGSGAKGLTTHGGGNGGRGGNGGAGGGGGGGAGGNSGPSVVVAMIGNVTFAGNPVYYAGATGTPGRGGAGAASGAKKACTAPNGEDGSPGAVVQTQQY